MNNSAWESRRYSHLRWCWILSGYPNSGARRIFRCRSVAIIKLASAI
jgi:hypothetical protein